MALNMSSMIDVTFLLLIYFIVTTVLNPPEDQLTPALKVEQGVSSNQSDLDPQIVTVTTIRSVPVYKIGEQVLQDRIQLAALLAKLPHDPGLIVRVDDTIRVEFAIAAVQEARNAGFDRVTYVPASD
ncbi:MAG: biopolymer transporter ExbD [Phycisphaerales bacterium]|jgi:biopolymer transport protein ExbD|nr:biopolymer transporter ExbD [Phycisphaerales bacterium]